MQAKLDQDIVRESNDVELLGVTIDNNIRFDKHVSNICLNASRNLNALTRVAKFVPFKKELFFLKHLQKHKLNIVYLYGRFMKG